MFQKLLLKNGYIPASTLDSFKRNGEVILAERNNLYEENLKLRAENASLRGKSIETKSYMDVSLGDPAPTKGEERKVYISSVAGFFKSILEPKIKHMISVTHNMLEETNSDRDFDLVLKGVVYSFREFLKWGEASVNEQLANQTETAEAETRQLQEELNKQNNG